MGNPTQQFGWSYGAAIYPAGSNPWNSQPLAVAPAQNWFTPGQKIPAENLNYIYGQIALDLSNLYGNGTVSVASLAAFRALPVPAYNATVLCTPENAGNILVTIGVPIGGLYYYDPAYAALDNSSTCIQPNAIVGTAPGRWRLTGGPLFKVYDAYFDNAQAAVLRNYTAGPITSGTSQFASGGVFGLVAWATGVGPGNIYLGDTITLDAVVVLSALGAAASSASLFYTRGATPIGPSSIVTVPVGTTAQTVPLKMLYTVTAADITAGTLAFSMYMEQVTGTATLSGAINSMRTTIERT